MVFLPFTFYALRFTHRFSDLDGTDTRATYAHGATPILSKGTHESSSIGDRSAVRDVPDVHQRLAVDSSDDRIDQGEIPDASGACQEDAVDGEGQGEPDQGRLLRDQRLDHREARRLLVDGRAGRSDDASRAPGSFEKGATGQR